MLTRAELEQIRNSRTYDDTLNLDHTAESGISLEDDLNFIFSQIRHIIGTTNWFDSVPASLSELSAVSGMQTVTWQQVFNNGSGLLNLTNFDANITIPSGRTWKFNNDLMQIRNNQVLIRNKGRRERFSPDVNVGAGIEIIIPNGATYTLGDLKFRNLLVYRNGFLQSPGFDYNETSSSGVTFPLSSIKKNEVLQFIINA